MAPLRLDRAFLCVSGDGARDFLQNLLTQDLGRLDAQPAVYAGLLTAQGKVIADMLVWRGEGDAFLLEADPARAEALLQRLLLYRLRAPLDIADVSAAHAALVAFDDAPAGFVADPRMTEGGLGFRRAAPRGEAEGLADGAHAFYARRVGAGAPDLAVDAGAEEVFALEALFEELHGVDFAKGCFVGQENVSRMKRRATTRKKFCPIVFAGRAPAFGAPVLAGEAEIGVVASGVEGRALALLRLDRAAEALAAGVQLSAEGKPVRLDPPPWLIFPQQQSGRA